MNFYPDFYLLLCFTGMFVCLYQTAKATKLNIDMAALTKYKNTKVRYVIDNRYINYVRQYHGCLPVETCIECKKPFCYPIVQLLTGIPAYDLAQRACCLDCCGIDIKKLEKAKKKWPFVDIDVPDWYVK